MEIGSWVQIEFKNESIATHHISNSCGVKTDFKTFMTFGGHNKDGEVLDTVLTFNLETEEVKVNPPMKFARTKLACVLIDKSKVLITGGTNKVGRIPQDEVFDLVRQYSTLSTSSMITPRYDHSMALLGETVLAFGGRNSSGSEVQSVEMYNNGSWELHPNSLLSTSTAALATTLFPHSSLDCDVGCQCGGGLNTRIIGGMEAEVRPSPL